MLHTLHFSSSTPYGIDYFCIKWINSFVLWSYNEVDIVFCYHELPLPCVVVSYFDNSVSASGTTAFRWSSKCFCGVNLYEDKLCNMLLTWIHAVCVFACQEMFSAACVSEFSVHFAACFPAVKEWDGVAALQKLCYYRRHLLLLQNAHTPHPVHTNSLGWDPSFLKKQNCTLSHLIAIGGNVGAQAPITHSYTLTTEWSSDSMRSDIIDLLWNVFIPPLPAHSLFLTNISS